jgi:hypothetical protein
MAPPVCVATATPAVCDQENDAEVYSVQVVRGEHAIQGVAAELEALQHRSAQGKNPLLRLGFFLGRVRLFPRNRPVVLMVRSNSNLEGAVLLYEKTFCGIPTGYLRGFDHLTGESCVIAPKEKRVSLLQKGMQQLFASSRTRVAWATVSLGPSASFTPSATVNPRLRMEANTHAREHTLKLSDTFDKTLSGFGSHTRRNLRYYRRRVEKELGAVYQPELSEAQSSVALGQLEQFCFQPSRVCLEEWKNMAALLRTQPGYFAAGLEANGSWLSYLAGIRSGDFTYVLLQINDHRLLRYSLSTAMRSCFFEQEILRGQKEIKFVNGTCAQFQRCCEVDTCVTVSSRRGLTASALAHWVAPWYSAPDHALNIRRWASRHQASTPAE